MKKEICGMATSHDGAKLSYVYYPAETKNPLLIFSNGVVCIETYWVPLIKHLRGRYPMVTWDYRGHGKTPVPDDVESPTMENHARDAAAVMDAIGFDKCVHFGFSMGVQVALEFYRWFPERACGLGLVCGPYKTPYDVILQSQLVGKAICWGLGLGLTFNKEITPIVRWFCRSRIAFPMAKIVQVDWRTRREDMQSYFDHLAVVDLNFGIHALLKMNEHSAEDVLPTVKVPTIIIAGEKDTWTPMRVQEEMHSMIPGSEMVVIPHGTHATPIEHQRAVNCTVEVFLRNHYPYDSPGKNVC